MTGTPTNIPDVEPELVFAGQTVEWYRSLPDYLATVYTLKYYLTGPASVTLTATAYNTTDHKISVTSATTAAWTYGIYKWQAFAETGAGATLQKWLVGSGFLTVKTTAGKSHAKTMLDAIETLLQGKTSDVSAFSIGGRSITKLSPKELEYWRNKYASEYEVECDRERLLLGKATRNRVYSRL